MAGKEKYGILSRQSILDEIRNNELLANISLDECLQPSCYDLCIGKIFTDKHILEEEKDSYILEPGGMITVATKEIVKLPANIAGLILPRCGLSEKGIVLVNAGHVEPGFEGFLMARLINFGKEPYPLRVSMRICSIQFAYLDQSTDTPRLKRDPHDERVQRLFEQASRTGKTIFDLYIGFEKELRETLLNNYVSKSEFTWELLKRVLQFFGGIAALAGLIATLIAIVQYFTK